MSHEGEPSEKRSFKVVDRRRFTEDGEERTSPDIRADRPRPQPEAAAPPDGAAPPAGSAAGARATAAQPGAPAAQPTTPPPAADEEDGIPFIAFVQSLAQQAMMQLGMVPWPHTNQRELQLEGARDTIDILAMLKSKTKGNLNESEAQLIEAALYELRMAWVEINRQLAARAKQGTPPTGA